jgi:hypothetical protein
LKKKVYGFAVANDIGPNKLRAFWNKIKIPWFEGFNEIEDINL